MKIFLTGGTGYLGAQLREALVAAGHHVTLLARRPPPPDAEEEAEPSSNGRVRWIEGDLAGDLPGVDVLSQHRVVIHCAAMVKTWARDRGEFDRVNVEAYDRLLQVCSRAGVSKILHTSSFLSLGPAPSPDPLTENDRRSRTRFYTDYERTKYLADEVTHRWTDRGLPVVSLYPTILFGPGGRTDGNLLGKMAYWVRNGSFPGLIGPGDKVWNVAFVPDVVAGHLAAIDRGLPGEGYVLGGENVRFVDLLRQIHELLDRPFRVRKLPQTVAEAVGSLMELGARFTGKAPELTRGVAGVYREHWCYSSAKAERALGYRITPLDDALHRTTEWVRSLDRWEC